MTVELSVDNSAGWDEYDKLSLMQIEDAGYDSISLDDDWVMFDPKRINVIKIDRTPCSLEKR